MKILFLSLGCDKNLVDSEVMLGMLTSRGYEITDDENEADIIVINTCCFIHDAMEESIQNILDMAEYKKNGKAKALIVAGCLAQRYRQEILDEIPEVDEVLGTTAIDQIIRAVDQALEGRKEVILSDLNALPLPETRRAVSTGGHFAYLKIAEGCDKHCTYCIIPKLRGSYRSVPMERLLKEARDLADQGVKELILVAQETTLYGKDIYGEKSLHRLVKELCRINGIQWIRILYCYPEEITDELIQVMKEEKKVCHYLDLPIQHANDQVLKRMGRRTTKQELIDIVSKLRKEIPDVVIRSTLMVGFPGETEEDFEELYEFVKWAKLDKLGCFAYSKEEGTVASRMEDQVHPMTKKRRYNKIMALQQEMSKENMKKHIGKTLKVLVENSKDDSAIGRTYMDVPDIDGVMYIKGKAKPSTFVNCKVTDFKEYDLMGEIK